MKKIILIILSFFFYLGLSAQCGLGEKEVRIEILPDAWPDEITWDLAEDGIVIASGNFVGDTICVNETACVRFTIYDSYGDGLSGGGSYSVFLDDVLIGTGSNYTDEESTMFNCPPGTYCSSAIAIGEGTYTAPSTNFWYSFTPTVTGMYEISTCGTNSCDTKVWVYDYCNSMINETTNVGTLFYDDNEGGCGEQAVVSSYLAGGEEYKIRIGFSETETCATNSINFSLTYMGPVVGCTDPAACNYNPLATVSNGLCDYFPSPNCTGGPDLMIVESAVINTLEIRQQQADNCMVEEGCMNGTGERTVLAFDTHIKNVGNMDYYIGDPTSNPSQFTFENCHGHPHYEGYADYILYTPGGLSIPIGHKNGFCVLDLECSDGGTATYGCGNMGISKQCGDIYNSGLDCQWVDITDVDTGQYILAIKVNWDQSPDALGRTENNYENNWAQACIRITMNGAGQKGFEILPNCQPFVDCAGVQFGNSVVDCNGNCGGTAVKGDIDANGTVQIVDANGYSNGIVNNTLATTSCNDISGDGVLTVWDAALAEKCATGTGGNVCEFPNTVQNLDHYVEIGYTEINTTDHYVDVFIKNPLNAVLGYELDFSGITIADAENLIDVANYPITPQFMVGGTKVIGMSYLDSVIPKHFQNTPLVRVYYSAITSATNDICVNAVHVVNNNSHPTFVNVLEGCVSIASIDERGIPSFSMKPNPANEKVSIEIGSNVNEKLNISITDALGRTISQKTLNAYETSVDLDISNLANGFYQVVIS
ncbi:MAG: lysyl oxidase family protein, partial [Bacteroidota bacterium]